MKTKLFIAVLLSIAFFSCSKKVASPVANSEVKVTEEVKTDLPIAIIEGKKLYENNCVRCHKLFPTTKHDKSGWAGTLDRMAPKAKITDEQKTLVYNYLTYGM